MYKGIFILYLVCFGCYLLFTRQPDFFDGERVPATIHLVKDSASANVIPQAIYHDGYKVYAIDARYVFRTWNEGDQLLVIYETDNPASATVYRLWGYGITWGELLASVVLCIALFQVAVTVTRNPSAESVLEQMETGKEKKRRYMD